LIEIAQPQLAFSVIINCYNGEEFLRQAIESVYSQTFSDWEIILWDNASIDDTPVIANSYDQKLRYFRSEETLPLGAARNRAISEAEGEYLAFLDADDFWYEKKLEKYHHAILRSKGELIYSNCHILYADGKTKDLFSEDSDLPSGSIFTNLLKNYCVNFQTLVVSRKVLERMGEWFDEYFEVAEDMDFVLRASLDSQACGLKEILSAYRVHSASFTWRKSSSFITEKNRILDKLVAQSSLNQEEEKLLRPSFLDPSYRTHAIACVLAGRRREALSNLAKMSKKTMKSLFLEAALLLLPSFLVSLLMRKFFFGE
jgi:glycosyltransferase involved in cell wall biosynthesis